MSKMGGRSVVVRGLVKYLLDLRINSSGVGESYMGRPLMWLGFVGWTRRFLLLNPWIVDAGTVVRWELYVSQPRMLAITSTGVWATFRTRGLPLNGEPKMIYAEQLSTS